MQIRPALTITFHKVFGPPPAAWWEARRFWGLLARGATFTRGTDRRPTRPGRALIRANRAGLGAAENVGNVHHALWMAGKPTPVAPSFDRLAEEWLAAPDDGTLTVHWPAPPPHRPARHTAGRATVV